MALPGCSVIIRSYNEERLIGRLLAGILQQEGVSSPEIILVDSGSTDATTAIAARYPVEIVRIAPADFSFGRSLNRGIAHARAEYVVVASAHVYPRYRDWLARLVAPLSDPQTALAYGKQRGDERSYYSERQIFRRWFPDRSCPRQAHPFCNNANAALRRALWEQVPYDETLTGLEDLAWAKRVMELGHSIAYVAEAEVVHVHDETPARILNRYRREAIAMRRICPEERFDLFDFAYLLCSNVLGDLLQAQREQLMWHCAGEIMMFRLMQLWGAFRGFSERGEATAALKKTFYYPGWAPHFDDELRASEGGSATGPYARRRVDYSTAEAGGDVKAG